MALAGSVSPVTATGVGRGVVVPSPSCPTLFAPQQYATPSTTAHECAVPTATSNAGDQGSSVVGPVMSSGIASAYALAVAPFPICPDAFLPQPQTLRCHRGNWPRPPALGYCPAAHA